jgi:S1-C subfamily serine protease
VSNGQPTRDLNEVVRLLGEHDAGDVVEVSYRRGKVHGSAKVTLVPR